MRGIKRVMMEGTCGGREPGPGLTAPLLRALLASSPPEPATICPRDREGEGEREKMRKGRRDSGEAVREIWGKRGRSRERWGWGER